MTIDQLKSVLTDFDSEVTNNLTPYGASKEVNSRLGTNLPPQMFYNYVKKGFITAQVTPEGKWEITPESLRVWMERYSFRNIITL